MKEIGCFVYPPFGGDIVATIWRPLNIGAKSWTAFLKKAPVELF